MWAVAWIAARAWNDVMHAPPAQVLVVVGYEELAAAVAHTNGHLR